MLPTFTDAKMANLSNICPKQQNHGPHCECVFKGLSYYNSYFPLAKTGGKISTTCNTSISLVSMPKILIVASIFQGLTEAVHMKNDQSTQSSMNANVHFSRLLYLRQPCCPWSYLQLLNWQSLPFSTAPNLLSRRAIASPTLLYKRLPTTTATICWMQATSTNSRSLQAASIPSVHSK